MYLQVIYMARNPKDLVVSYYQFHRSLRTMSYRGTFQEFCRRFMNDKCKYWTNELHFFKNVYAVCLTVCFSKFLLQWDTAPGLSMFRNFGNIVWIQMSYF